MLTAIVLRDRELSTLTRHETLALEYLLHDRFSEIARARHNGDSALLLAVRAADYLTALLDDLGEPATSDVLARMGESPLGLVAFDRTAAVAQLTANRVA